MNPAVTLIPNVIITEYLSPDNLDVTPLLDYEEGGIGLSDPSQGLQVQPWTLTVRGTGINTSVWLDAPNTPAVQQFALSNITWARLAFDQNMHPVISYVYQNGCGLWWYDPTIPGQTFLTLPATASFPCVTLDDKRPISTRLGTSDVVLCYINGTNLCYRLQRDRYATEYVWMSNITSKVSNPFVNKIGMTFGYRLLLDIRGALYQ
jgi:hypothetical protein